MATGAAQNTAPVYYPLKFSKRKSLHLGEQELFQRQAEIYTQYIS